VALVGWRPVTLPLENMPEVTPTSITGDLDAFHAQRTVHVAGYGARDSVEKGGPAAAAVELCAALVKRRFASSAGINSSRLVMLVLSRPGLLGAFQPDHPELFGSEDRAPFLIGLGLASVRHLSDGG